MGHCSPTHCSPQRSADHQLASAAEGIGARTAGLKGCFHDLEGPSVEARQMQRGKNEGSQHICRSSTVFQPPAGPAEACEDFQDLLAAVTKLAQESASGCESGSEERQLQQKHLFLAPGPADSGSSPGNGPDHLQGAPRQDAAPILDGLPANRGFAEPYKSQAFEDRGRPEGEYASVGQGQAYAPENPLAKEAVESMPAWIIEHLPEANAQHRELLGSAASSPRYTRFIQPKSTPQCCLLAISTHFSMHPTKVSAHAQQFSLWYKIMHNMH